MRLDPASTPLKLVLLAVLDLCLFFMPDPRLLDPVSLFRCSCCRIREQSHGKVAFAYVLRLGQFEACRTWGSVIIIMITKSS